MRENNRDVYRPVMESTATTRFMRNASPGVNFKRVWRNINSKIIPARIKSVWYYAVHDIIPTGLRLNKIHQLQMTNVYFVMKRIPLFIDLCPVSRT